MFSYSHQPRKHSECAMPKPVFIICAENIAVDQDSNLVSIFNALENIQVNVQVSISPRRGKKAKTQLVIQQRLFKAVAVWMREEDDVDKKFESQMAIILPDETEKATETTPFTFSPGPKQLQRFVLSSTIPPLAKSGIMRVQSRVRKLGRKRWMVQDYPISIEVVTATPTRRPKMKRRKG